MTTMQAVVLTRFGGPEVLECREVPRPEPRADQMLVRVAACGVCGHDLLNRNGNFPETRPPCVMGHEIAGTVETVGDLVTGFQPGDRVALTQRMSCGVCRTCRAGRDNLCRNGANFYGDGLSGGYGAYVVASPRNALHLPPAIDFATGAILSCAVGTGWHALARARVAAGDTVVVTAASGGVGIHTIQLARLLGLTVIAVTSSDHKSAMLAEAGAHHVVVANGDAGFHRDVRDLTGGGGADAVIEIAGVPTFQSSIRSLAAGGRLVAVGNMQPGNVPLNPALPILKEIEIVGSGHALVADLARLIALASQGLVRPLIADIMPVARAADAHHMMSRPSRAGRLVLSHQAP
jgi:D-arabinose 1-dehydrogenase-like Zn-dependent alcohol dehydrogenase